MKLLFSPKLFSLALLLFVSHASLSQNRYEKDFEEFWSDIHANYAYFDKQKIDWDKVKTIYGPKVKDVANDQDFIRMLENILFELHNGHISLNTNLAGSNRLVPSGQDMYVEFIDQNYVITDIRKGFGAELCGLKTGMRIAGFNGKPIGVQLQRFLPKFTDVPSPAMQQFALDMLFAGTYDAKRQITVVENGRKIDFFPDDFTPKTSVKLLDSGILNPTTAFIKINNSLGSNELIASFDRAVDSLMNFKNIVIDLTETPGGGNTTVARAIMGRFISEPKAYQKHEFDETGFDTKRVWIEYASPRKQTFTGNMYILVGHWTGSMGEGVAIGFDGMQRGRVIGTKMGGLIGAINGFRLSQTQIGFQIPTERLYHVDGTPREDFIPKTLTKNTAETLKKRNEIRLASDTKKAARSGLVF